MNVSKRDPMEIRRFNKVLVANRGEIAVRVINACRDLHISSVAVYSTEDALSLHVQLADEALCLGAPEASDSYLNIDRIIWSAKKLGVDAIHPGYGFLAENAAMADACERNDIVFIGPTALSMKAVASKEHARQLVDSLSLPTIPGLNQLVSYSDEFVAQCEAIGFPVLLKATAGGGGVGMRIVEHGDDLQAAFEAVSRESQQAFGDGGIIVEKYLANARHIEVQVLADRYGHCVHLHERDCSIQRRRQKIVEESPARLLPAGIKQSLCDTAVAIAKHINYRGAGTVEFLYSPEHQQFYFLEMNTRLQVEHGVTELVTGIDIVQWQLRLAEGEALTLAQANIPQNGHAIECRICAENPSKGFIPAIGTIEYWAAPKYQRCDSGVQSGDRISIYYDSLVAKVIACGDDFFEANRNLQTALNQSVLLGVDNNLSYLRKLISSDLWRGGGLDTQAVERNHALWASPLSVGDRDYLLCSALAAISDNAESQPWPGQHYNPQIWQVSIAGMSLDVESRMGLNDRQTLVIDGQSFESKMFSVEPVERGLVKRVDIEVNQHRFRALCVVRDNEVFVHSDTIGALNFTLGSVGQSVVEELSSDVISSPMPAKIIAISVSVGDQVIKGQVLLVLESMKMETSIVANRDGVIAGVNISEGELVEAYTTLIELAEEK